MHETEHVGWLIRRASKSDSRAIARLHRALNRPKRTDSVPSEFFVAEVSARIVGCAGVRKWDCFGYLYGLGVDKSWRRQGIGHALTQRRLDWLREAGASSAFVLAMFWNIRFFKKHGFKSANRAMKQGLGCIHRDFSESWSSRSVLLAMNLSGIGSRSTTLQRVNPS